MNTMQSRTTGAISLGATGNVQGTYRFFNLHTGEIIVRRKWNELPIPKEAITRLQDITYAELDTNYYEDINDSHYDEPVSDKAEMEQEDKSTTDHNDKILDTVRETHNETSKIPETTNNEVTQEILEESRIEEMLPDEEESNTKDHEYNLRPNRKKITSFLSYL
jgi:predicted small metal-binding protein